MSGINDSEHARKEAIKAEILDMNAEAVAGTLRGFEARLAEQDKKISNLHAKMNALESRLNIQMSLEKTAEKMGNGPTTG